MRRSARVALACRTGWKCGKGDGLPSPPEIETARLRLRPWHAEDRPVFATLNADPRVMEHLHAVLSRRESDALVDRIEAHFRLHGFGLWAVELREAACFAGFVGLSVPRFEAHFTPCVEVGWRLAPEHWGQGFATEAAMAALAFGFEQLALGEIVSFTVAANQRSRGVMERIGMTHEPADDFDHPMFDTSHRLCRHVLYRKPRA